MLPVVADPRLCGHSQAAHLCAAIFACPIDRFGRIKLPLWNLGRFTAFLKIVSNL